MLETSNLARKYTNVVSVSTGAKLSLLMPAFFADVSKISIFWQKITFTPSNNVRAVLEIF